MIHYAPQSAVSAMVDLGERPQPLSIECSPYSRKHYCFSAIRRHTSFKTWPLTVLFRLLYLSFDSHY